MGSIVGGAGKMRGMSSGALLLLAAHLEATHVEVLDLWYPVVPSVVPFGDDQVREDRRGL